MRQLARYGALGLGLILNGSLPRLPARAALGAETARQQPAKAVSHWHKKLSRRIEDSLVQSLVFSPDGKLLAVGDGYRKVHLWDVATGKERAVLRARTTGNIYSLAFSPDGKLLASGNFGGHPSTALVRLWEVSTGKQLARLDGPDYTVMSLTFSPNGKFLAAAGCEGFLGFVDPAYAVKVWDVATRKEVFLLENEFTGRGAVLFLPDNKTLVVPRPDGTVKLWDVTSKKERGAFPVAGNSVAALALKGKALVVLPDFFVTAMAQSAGLAPDKKTVAGADLGAVKVYDLPSGKLRATLKLGTTVYAVVVSGDGSLLLGAGVERARAGAARPHPEVSVLKWWDLASGKERGQERGDTSGPWGWNRAASLSPDGRRLATGSGQDVTIWALEKGPAEKPPKRQRQ